MLVEIVFENSFYVRGTVAEVRQHLARYAEKYSTVRELLDDLSPLKNNIPAG